MNYINIGWSICETQENINIILDIFEKAGYKYIIKTNDKLLKWGNPYANKHVQLIGAVNEEHRHEITQDIYRDTSFNYTTYWRIEKKTEIKASTKKASYSIRNDWTRAERYLKASTKRAITRARKKASILYDIIILHADKMGNRERNTIDNLKSIKIESVNDWNGHEIITLYDKNGDFIRWDFSTKNFIQ